MASSPASAERRSKLIREMSRGHSRASAASSDAGSDHISVKDWGIESQPLPALPTFTPDNVSKRAHEPEFQINTSALRRAFPDFSQHGSSDEDSIELGRGLPRRDPSARILPSEDPSENISLNLGDGEKFTVTGTPPLKPKNMQQARVPLGAQRQAAKPTFNSRHVSEKENQDPAVKTTSHGSSASSGDANAQQKPRTVYASVEADDSISIPTRPKSQYASAKSTRFTSPAARQSLAETNNLQNIRASQAANSGTVDSTDPAMNGTYQSFMLPDMPNMTELMTGQGKDRTPNASRSVRNRSRFGTPSALRKSQNARPAHNALGDVPVPADAKALYASLQQLQEKVKNLENERDQAVEKADNYELELLQLRSKVEEHEMMNTIDTQDDNKGKEWDSERAKFEKSIKTLQARLKQANKKITVSETTIKNLTKDRNVAQQQLGEAYFNSEELRTESQAVRDQINAVKAQLVRVTKHHENRIEKLVAQENELRGKIDRREKAVNEMATLAKELWSTRNALARKPSTSMARSRAQSTTTQKPVDVNETSKSRHTSGASRQSRPKSLDVNPPSKLHSRRTNLEDSLTLDQNMRHTSSSTTRHYPQEQYQDENFEPTSQQDSEKPLECLSVADLERCETYLSFMEGDEVAKLRAVLQQDKARLTSAGTNHVDLDYPKVTKSTVPRKSSLKDANKPSSKKQQVQYEDDNEICQEITGEIARPQSRASARSRQQTIRDDDPLSTQFNFDANQDKDDTRQSVRSVRSEHRRRNSAPAVSVHDENMTSAYILPDITMTGAELASNVQPKSDLDAQHNTKLDTASPKEKIAVSYPTPVSARPISPNPSNPDPTLRPSREPSVALTLVIRSLEAEIVRLREQLARYEAMYNQTDPSLSKRKRKAVWARIVKVGEAVERRCDQVYSLYDVLEGFKRGLSGEEVEVTLGELGLDGVVHGVMHKEENQDQDSGDELPLEDDELSDEAWADDDAPFEGFETTGTQTQTGLVTADAN